MKINVAHLRERSTTGGWLNFAVFDAKSFSGRKSKNSELLHQLTIKARASGLKIDQSALVFKQNGDIQFQGSKNLVNYLSDFGVPTWTHTIDM